MNPFFFTHSLRAHSTLCVLLLLASNLVAQQPQEPVLRPEPPFIAPMPERLQWSVVVKSHSEGARASSPDASEEPAVFPWSLRRVDSTKTGIYKHIVETYQNGQQREYWFVGKMMLDTDCSKKNVMVVDCEAFQRDAPLSLGDPQPTAGWEAFSWISLSTYKERVNLGKEPCYHYVLDENSKVSAEAWVSARTKFPLVYRFRNQTYLYQYGPEPADLQLPREYEKKWEQYQQMVKRAQRIQNSGPR